MQFKLEPQRISYAGKDGEILAEVAFPCVGDNTVDINHTFVDESLRGQGIAGKLMEAAALELRRRGLKARLSCSYAVKWFAAHPEYGDLLI